jgi:adenylate cyclase
MDRIWQWAWDRYGARYSWVVYGITFALLLPNYLLWSWVVVTHEKSGQYGEAIVITVAGVLALVYVLVLPGLGLFRLIERWAGGHEIHSAMTLEATYALARATVVRALVGNPACVALLFLLVGAIAGAGESRLIQYGLLGGAVGLSSSLMSMHSYVETALRPARVAMAGDTAIGDGLPRARPSFVTWSNISVLAEIFVFSVASAMLAAVFKGTREVPFLALAIGFGLTACYAVPIAVVAMFSPSMRPIRDLAEGTERVAAGDYSQRLPVVQDDDLGALAASFNRMQAGLAERQRLHSAFGTYVDPALAARLLEQGDDVFTGERREVTVMFIDIRDFTPFAEANTAEDTVARLNALFEIVVPAVVETGGHVNKFLGDGALAVFGAPNDLSDHADAAVAAAILIQRLVAKRLGGELRIGIGINTGVVIAGTIGGGGKLEFTLIGDTVNVAARVEQLTKTTGDAILLTQQCVDALTSRPLGLIDRGFHVLKGKSASVQVFSLDQETDARVDLSS